MKLAPGTWRLAAPPLVVAVLLVFLAPYVAMALAVLGLGVVWFHRDPDRSPDGDGVLSPADGRVSVVREEQAADPAATHRTDGDGSRVRVGVFMNVTDVHVNRAPTAGEVREVTHEPGANRPAFTKESDRNEKVHVDCGDLTVTLIAGWFARRIRPYVEPGDSLDRGSRLGHVSFGSRADVLLPAEFGLDDLAVEEGDQVRAGETVIARRPDE